MGNSFLGQPASRIYDSKHISPFLTVGSTTTGDHRASPLMLLNSLAPAFLPHSQSSSDQPISVCNSTTLNLPLAQLFCGMPPQIIPSHAPSINQHVTDGTFLLLLLQPTNQSKLDAAAHQPSAGSSTLLSSPLRHQANCLQAIHKTIQQFNRYLKAENVDRQKLHFIVLQLQIDFALLRYLLFYPIETISNKDTAVKNSATSPLPSPTPNPNATLTACTEASKLRHSTPVGAVGPPRAKTNNSVNANFQPPPDTQEAPATTAQNVTSRISKLEKMFADEIATYKSITAGIHSQYFFLYDLIRQLEPGNSEAIIWKTPSMNSTLQKWPNHHLIPSSNWPQVSLALPSGLTPMDTTFWSKSSQMAMEPLLASLLQYFSPCFLVIMTIYSDGSFQRSSASVVEINWTH